MMTVPDSRSFVVRHKRLIILSAVMLALISGLQELYLYISNRSIQRESAEWLTKAIQASSSDTKFDDARSWLTSNGFEILVWNPHSERGFIGERQVCKNGSEARYLCVIGQRCTRTEGIMHDPAWATVVFLFARDGTLVRVELEPTSLRLANLD